MGWEDRTGEKEISKRERKGRREQRYKDKGGEWKREERKGGDARREAGCGRGPRAR